MRNPNNTERYTGEVSKDKNKLNKRESQTQYLTRFGNLPTSSGQGRERDLIDSTINYNLFLLQGISNGNFSGIQYMRALALIYSHRVPGF